jgi:lysyl-tRNA synthetase class II
MSDAKVMHKQRAETSKYYMTIPLENLDVTDLTDAIGVTAAATLLKTSERAIYTVRNTKSISVERMQTLVATIQSNEMHYRQRLATLRNNQAARKAKKELVAG